MPAVVCTVEGRLARQHHVAVYACIHVCVRERESDEVGLDNNLLRTAQRLAPRHRQLASTRCLHEVHHMAGVSG